MNALLDKASSILGYGVIGLGLLLAILAYRLLSNGVVRERPIYVFEGFCLTVVIIGAVLQYSSTTAGAITARNQTLQDELRTANDKLSATQTELQSAKEGSSAALTRALKAESTLASASGAMAKIASLVPTELDNLRNVNNVLTDAGACPGGPHGVPLPHGSATANLNANVIGYLTAVKSTIDQAFPH
jgi:hypothetical protein